MLKKFIKFGLVGISNTILSYAINMLALYLLKSYNLSWDYILANIVAYFLSVLWAFYWNSRYVFNISKVKGYTRGKMLLKTYISYGFTGILLANVLSYIWINIVGLSKGLAPLFNLLVSVPLNFIINKIWTFAC